jgi:D-lactate dehydrogenase (quinone)
VDINTIFRRGNARTTRTAFDTLRRHISLLPHNLSAKILRALGHLVPQHPPRRMTDDHNRVEPYRLLKMGDDGSAEARADLPLGARQGTEDIVTLDIALRRDDENGFETLPVDIENHSIHKLYCRHFFCHIFHQGYIAAKDSNCQQIEAEMWTLLNRNGAE